MNSSAIWEIIALSHVLEGRVITRGEDILATPSVYGWIQLFSSLGFVDQGINCTRFSINKVAKEAKVFLASAF